MRATTSYFGEIEYSGEEVLAFPGGLPAFEQEREFVCVRNEQSWPLVFLQSLSNPLLCFVTVPVGLLIPGYRVSALAEDLERIGLPGGEQPEIGCGIDCLAVLTLAAGQEPTANLLAPILVNVATRQAVQSVQVDTEYSCKHPLGRMGAERC